MYFRQKTRASPVSTLLPFLLFNFFFPDTGCCDGVNSMKNSIFIMVLPFDKTGKIFLIHLSKK